MIYKEPVITGWFLKVQAFLRSYIWFGSSPPPATCMSLFLFLPVCRRSSLLIGSKIIRPRESLILYKSFITLCPHTAIGEGYSQTIAWYTVVLVAPICPYKQNIEPPNSASLSIYCIYLYIEMTSMRKNVEDFDACFRPVRLDRHITRVVSFASHCPLSVAGKLTKEIR